MTKPQAIVIGSSSGGLPIIEMLIKKLKKNYLPIVIVQHIGEDSPSFLHEYLNRLSVATIKEAEANEPIQCGYVYLAPPGYHLLIEADKTFSLSFDERVNFSRPSIDVLFDSAADAYQDQLIGVILSGANSDGAKGLNSVKAHGGITIVQDPKASESSYMPEAALKITNVDKIARPEALVGYLLSF